MNTNGLVGRDFDEPAGISLFGERALAFETHQKAAIIRVYSCSLVVNEWWRTALVSCACTMVRLLCETMREKGCKLWPMKPENQRSRTPMLLACDGFVSAGGAILPGVAKV